MLSRGAGIPLTLVSGCFQFDTPNESEKLFPSPFYHYSLPASFALAKTHPRVLFRLEFTRWIICLFTRAVLQTWINEAKLRIWIFVNRNHWIIEDFVAGHSADEAHAFEILRSWKTNGKNKFRIFNSLNQMIYSLDIYCAYHAIFWAGKLESSPVFRTLELGFIFYQKNLWYHNDNSE